MGVVYSGSSSGGSSSSSIVILDSFNGPLSRTTWVGRYQEGKTNLDFTEA